MINYLSNSPPPKGAFLLRFKEQVTHDALNKGEGCCGKLNLPIAKDTVTWVRYEHEFTGRWFFPENNIYGTNMPNHFLVPAGPVLENDKIYKIIYKRDSPTYFLAKCKTFGTEIRERGQIISQGTILNSDTYRVGGTFNHYLYEDGRACELAGADDIKWFEACEKAGRFIKRDEALRPPEVKWQKEGWCKVVLAFHWNNIRYNVGDILRVDRYEGDGSRRVYLEDRDGQSVYANTTDHNMPEVEWLGMIEPPGTNWPTDLDRHILQECKRKYPPGTKFKPAHLGSGASETFTVTGGWKKARAHQRLFTCGIEEEEIYSPTLYFEGIWAHIVKEEPKTESLWPKDLLTDKSLRVISSADYVVQDHDIASMYPGHSITKIQIHSKNHINSTVENVKSVSTELKTKTKRVYF